MITPNSPAPEAQTPLKHESPGWQSHAVAQLDPAVPGLVSRCPSRLLPPSPAGLAPPEPQPASTTTSARPRTFGMDHSPRFPG